VDGRDQQMYYDGYLQGDSMVKQMTGLLKGFQTNPVYAKYPELAKLDPTTGYQLAGNKFLRNIVCYSGANSNLYLATDLWNDQTESDDNVIFHPGGDLGIDRNDGHGIAPALQWAAWKKLGFEAHSVVADPKFVDAAHDDYRLRKDSPALKLGFVPIPVDEIGPYVDPARASWPIVEAPGAREHPTPPETPIPGYGDAVARAAASKAPVPIGRWAGPAPTAAGPWPAGDFATFPLAQTPEGNAATGQPAVARVAYDDANLYVEINVPPGGPLKLGASWGKDEGGEVCFQALGTASSPINVIHGFANGAHECVTDAGASTGQAAKLDNAVLFQTQIQGNGWVAHWTIPWEATGVVPHPGAKFRFNLGLLHSGSGEWDNWIGTGDSTWRLQNAGSIVLK